MKTRNSHLKEVLGNIASPKLVKEINSLPKEDTVNLNNTPAYALPEELKLLGMLNTLMLTPQTYRSNDQQLLDLRNALEAVALKDPYFVCQCIIYSRTQGSGLRTVNHIAAALIAKFISGQPYAKRFYSLYNKHTKSGGCIYRPDDMSEIKDAYHSLTQLALSNAMKKGFASVIANLDAYQLTKYKKSVRDITNLVHAHSDVIVDGVNILDALMQGINVSADTWEVAQAEAGQEVAKAVREGKVDQETADELLKEAKKENWEGLLNDGKLGILAALRNIRNIIKSGANLDILCQLVSNGNLIRKGLIMPHQIDTAYEIVKAEFPNNSILTALREGYVSALPNLTLSGKTAILLDCSGSMHGSCYLGKQILNSSAIDKASLVAATIAKVANADIIRFGSKTEHTKVDTRLNVFSLASKLRNTNMGGTNIGRAFDALEAKYDRIILLSDYEANQGKATSVAYANYMRRLNCSPYVYCIDFTVYGTTPIKHEGKVNYYFGLGYQLFDDIANLEFNPYAHIDKVRKVKF